jgi:hypothetical protein
MQIPGATSSLTSNSSSTASSSNTGNSTGPSFQSLLGQLNSYVNETPAQRMYNSILAQLGITPQQLASMSPQDREKVEQKIQDLMKKEMQAQQQQQQQQTQQAQQVQQAQLAQTQLKQSVDKVDSTSSASASATSSSKQHTIPMINLLV